MKFMYQSTTMNNKKNQLFRLGHVKIDKRHPRIMGILNVSRESFYKKSIKTSQIVDRVKEIELEGADFIDIGGMSTAPYNAIISKEIEMRRITRAIKIATDSCNLPISIDTSRADVAKISLEMGAEIINDVTGLQYDSQMPKVIEKYQPSVILCAHGIGINHYNSAQLIKLLQKSIKIIESVKDTSDIVLDPAIGFFRQSSENPMHTRIRIPWFERDLHTINTLNVLSSKFTQPILVSVSNKSFINRINKSDNLDQILAGSLAIETVARIKGASIIRTHNVHETRKALQL